MTVLNETVRPVHPDTLVNLVNFPFICSNIPVAAAYRLYISQLISYFRACCFYHDFLDRGLLLTRKLLDQRGS